jgi:PAS domain S-box-containing protein
MGCFPIFREDISMKVSTKTKAELMKEVDGLRAQLKETEKKLSTIPEARDEPSEITARLILNEATDIIIVCDENGKVTRVSEVTHHYIGENLLSKPFDAILKLRFSFPHPLRKDDFSVSEVLRGKIFRKEEVILRREDRAFHFLLSARPLTDQHGRNHGCVVMLTDVTELKQMETELTCLASFPQLNPNPVVESDLAGHVHYSNPAAERLFPDLKKAGLNYPWLIDLEKISETLDTESRKTYVRELRVGDQ